MCLTVFRQHHASVHGVAFSPDGHRIASGSYDRRIEDGPIWYTVDSTVRVWDAETGAELAVLGGGEGGVTSVAFSPDGQRIAGGYTDASVRVWDTATGAELTIFRGHGYSVNSLTFSPDGGRVASAGGAIVLLWDVESGKELAVFQGHTDEVTSVAFSPDGRWIASGSRDCRVCVWNADIKTPARLVHFLLGWLSPTPRLVGVLLGHEAGVTSVVFSPNGGRVASGSYDGTARVWDIQSEAERTLTWDHENYVTTIVFSPDGRLAASGSYDHTVRVWDVASGRALTVLRGHTLPPSSLTFSPDGQLLASGSGLDPFQALADGCRGAENLEVRIWDARAGQLAVLRGHEERVTSVAFSPDGLRLVSGSEDNTVRVWDARTTRWAWLRSLVVGRERAVLRTGRSGYVTFSPDGRGIVSGSSERAAQVWDATSGTYSEVWPCYWENGVFSAGPSQAPFRVIAGALGTIIARSDGGEPAAWFPVELKHSTVDPAGRTWAGAVGSHVFIITLEGADVI